MKGQSRIDFNVMARATRWATGAWMAIILIVSLLPPEAGGRGGPIWHLIGYSVLALLLAAWQPVRAAALVAWTYGALIELLQFLVPNRASEGGDLLVNAAGVAIGLLVRALWPST